MYSDFFASARRKSKTTLMGAMPMPKFGNFGFYVAPVGFDENGRLCFQFENSRLVRLVMEQQVGFCFLDILYSVHLHRGH